MFKAFGPDDSFYGYDSGGDLVATLTFQAQRVYSGTINSDDVGLQIVAFVDTTSALGDKDQIKEMRLKTAGGWIKLDNMEDTEVVPNDTVGASLVNNNQRTLIDGIEEIELKLRNVTRWRKQ